MSKCLFVPSRSSRLKGRNNNVIRGASSPRRTYYIVKIWMLQPHLFKTERRMNRNIGLGIYFKSRMIRVCYGKMKHICLGITLEVLRNDLLIFFKDLF